MREWIDLSALSNCLLAAKDEIEKLDPFDDVVLKSTLSYGAYWLFNNILLPFSNGEPIKDYSVDYTQFEHEDIDDLVNYVTDKNEERRFNIDQLRVFVKTFKAAAAQLTPSHYI